ncbi:unnamed protein product [Rhizophagus irregularis]|nr:unnamed protein product [Rhizophagus irregularis]CAB5372640.1 unnamed protein product [Rhizophagus irregularis]
MKLSCGDLASNSYEKLNIGGRSTPRLDEKDLLKALGTELLRSYKLEIESEGAFREGIHNGCNYGGCNYGGYNYGGCNYGECNYGECNCRGLTVLSLTRGKRKGYLSIV